MVEAKCMEIYLINQGGKILPQTREVKSSHKPGRI
jgi:hypothetical protein